MPHIFWSDSYQRNISDKGDIPVISHGADSVRSYAWELQFNLGTLIPEAQADTFSFAAKSVGPIESVSERIPVDRVNDKVWYPGKVTNSEVTVVFEDLLKQKAGHFLYKWYQLVYNQQTGTFYDPGIHMIKKNIDILKLDNVLAPISHIKLIGAYPSAFREIDRDYGTNEMHKIEMTFSYDFVISVLGTPK